ncbi:MAG: haloacid dehalogenase-like hydrolase [Deltaproteobacteria bacterium]|nr:haloacid dehalogenase-like hydrolase [Deltaproteobacteria bacterium]
MSKLRPLLALSLLTLTASACGDDGSMVVDPQPDAPDQPQPDGPTPPTCEPTALRTDLTWYGDNATKLAGWLDAKGCASVGYDATKKPIALFDWDNTVLKNDVGDAITFHLIKNDKVLQPPNQDWKQSSKLMTTAAATALTTACGITVAAGQPLPTSTNTACADEILSIYIDGKTTGAVAAFENFDYRRIEPTYAWTAQLLAGYTHAEVQAMTIAAVTPQLAAPENTTQVIGTRTVNGWLRIYDQTKDVIAAATSRGYDVWVITASPQDVVAAMVPMVDLPADHVIGIRSRLDASNKLTSHFEGCGPVADDADTMISYIEGKRCWVNKVIYGDTTANAIARRPVGMRPIFAAGDSDTDIEFLRDASYRLVLNRNKKELMCFAYRNEDSGWAVNPMFIQPKSQQAALYPCSTTACKTSDGTPGPCRDESNTIIPDQMDLVHGP